MAVFIVLMGNYYLEYRRVLSMEAGTKAKCIEALELF